MTTPSSEAKKLSLSNPNLTISQLFKKIYRSPFPVEGRFLPDTHFPTHIPTPLILLETWTTHQAVHSQDNVL